MNRFKQGMCMSFAALAINAAFAATPYDLYWVGTDGTDLRSWRNWSPSRAPNNMDRLWFTYDASANLDRPSANANSKNSYAFNYFNASNCTVKLSTTNAVGELQLFEPCSLACQGSGRWVLSNVCLKPRYAIDLNSSHSFEAGSSNVVYSSKVGSIGADIAGFLEVVVNSSGIYAIGGTVAEDAVIFINADIGKSVRIPACGNDERLKDCIVTGEGKMLEWDGDVVTVVRAPQAFEWTNGAGDSKWSNVANWEIQGIGGVAVPTPADTVVFPADGAPWSVMLDFDATVTNFVANGAVSLSGGKKLTCSDFDGGGTLALSGVTLQANGADVNIRSDLEIAAGTTNYIKLAANKQYFNCHLFGNMIGAGYLDVQISADAGADRGMKFHGDNTAFAGTFASSVYYGRNGISFDSAACSSANAVWVFNNNSPKSNMDSALFTSTTDTYRFGAFRGKMKSGGGRRKVEFGGRADVETIVTLSNRHNGSGEREGGFVVTKIGDGAATFLTRTENGSPDNDSIETLDIQGGAVLLGSPAQMQTLSFTGDGGILGIAENITFDPSAFIKNSTAPICFKNSEGELHVWESPLAADNMGGFLKFGEGTLMLAAPPQYGGETTVREGMLVISNATDVAIVPGPATCMTIDEWGTATLEPPPPGTVAMSGTVPFDNFSDALAACLAVPSLPLTLLAPARDISLPLGASIRLRPDGHEYSFTVADHCRIDMENAGGGVIVCSHVWDIVTVTPPDIPNASLAAATNGVILARVDGMFRVLRGERVDFTWRPRSGYVMNIDAASITASENSNAISSESLPFSMSCADIENGAIFRVMDDDSATAKEFTAPASLATLSVEALSTTCTMRLDSTFAVSNIVFIAGAQLVIKPGAAFDDGDTLIAWQTPHSLNGFVLVSDFIADGWMLRSEPDGLKFYKASRCSVDGVVYSSAGSAFAASTDGGTVRLEQDSWLFDRIDIPSGETRTLDLGGHRLNVASFWAVNVGDASFAVTNGSIVCRHCGFYVTDGSLSFGGCRVAAAGRVAQICGAGTLDIAPDAMLETGGDDPVVFAIGGFAGRARVSSRGVARQQCAGGGEATASCFAGNGDDTFGADFVLSADSGAYMCASAADTIYHPGTQGGEVEIFGGWFASRPRNDWLFADFSMRQETLDEILGWRVFQPMPYAADEQSVAEILANAADAENLSANIISTREYGRYSDWVSKHSSCGAMNASRFAWTAFALDAPALIPRTAPLEPEDIELADFSAFGDDGAFSLVVGLKDIEIGQDADLGRLVKVFGLSGGISLVPEDFRSENVELVVDGENAGEVDDGKLKLNARPATPVDGTFFLRVNLKSM